MAFIDHPCSSLGIDENGAYRTGKEACRPIALDAKAMGAFFCKVVPVEMDSRKLGAADAFVEKGASKLTDAAALAFFRDRKDHA